MLTKLIKLIRRKSTPEKVLSLYKEPSEKGFVYEKLWDLVIKMGFCDLFPNNRYDHIGGKVNEGKPKIIKNIDTYIRKTKIINGNSSGSFDIILYDKIKEKYVIFTCKYFTEEKSVFKYDIQNIITVIDENSEIYQKTKIFLIVKNKEKLLEKVRNAKKSSYHITKYITEKRVLDLSDLGKYYKKLRAKLKEFDVIEDYNEIFGDGKINLDNYFHQRFLTLKSMKKIDEGETQFLLGCKPRSGKTFITGKLIKEMEELKITALIITPAPTETITQFTIDMFEKYRDFSDFEVLHIKTSEYAKNISTKLKNKNILVISKQLLQRFVGKDKLDLPKINVIFFDENHFGGTTDLSKKILSTYSSPTTVCVYLTATFNKPLQTWNIPEENRFYWDMEDEMLCKTRNITGLVEKHGEEITTIIEEMKREGKDLEDIMGVYDNYPELCLITTMMDKKRYQNIKSITMDSSYGFSFDSLFSFRNKKMTSFKFEEEVAQLLRFISGSKKEKDFKRGDKSIFGRINTIIGESNSRLPFTQLWFLPMQNIDETSKCLKEIMEKDAILKNYDILCVNSKLKIIDVKAEIEKSEKQAKVNDKRELIILAGGMLTLGITLKNCDVVFLLNNTLSADKIMQMSYRCMSEADKKQKKYGIVVDLNISRVLHR